MLPIREVTYAKCYLYEMLPRQSVLYEMLLYENVLYETLLIPKILVQNGCGAFIDVS